MANYNLVVDTSNFKPYTFDDMVKPMLLYDKAWDEERERAQKYIDQYGNLNLPSDSKAGRDYQNMLQQQQDAMESFYSGSLKQSMPKMMRAFDLQRGRGAKLRQAAENYQKYQDKLSALGNDAIIGNPLTIDDFYTGKPTAIKSISRKEVVQGAAAYATGLVKGLQSDPQFKQVYDGMIAQSWKTPMTNQDIVDAAMQNYASLSPQNAQRVNMAQQYMQRYMQSLGVDAEHGFNQDAQAQTWNAVTDGFVSAMTNNTNIQQDTSRQWQLQGLEVTGKQLENSYAAMRNKYYENNPDAFGGSNHESNDPYVIGADGHSYPKDGQSIEQRNQAHKPTDTPSDSVYESLARQGKVPYWDTKTGTWQGRTPGASDTEGARTLLKWQNKQAAKNANTGQHAQQQKNTQQRNTQRQNTRQQQQQSGGRSLADRVANS